MILKKKKLQEMELDLEIKHWTLRKLDLEIQKLEREVSISVHTVTITAIQCFLIFVAFALSIPGSKQPRQMRTAI